MNAPQMDLIGNVVSDNDAWFYEMFDEPCICFSKINSFINANADATDLHFRISSYGGDLNAAETCFNAIVSCGKKIKFEIIGQAYSAGAVLAFSANEIVVYKNTSRMMIHPALFESVSGNGKQMHEYGDYLDSRSNDIFNLIMERRPKAKERESDVRAAFDNEKELTASECIDLGLADTMIEVAPANVSKFKILNKSNISDMKIGKQIMDALNAFNTKLETAIGSKKDAPKNTSATTAAGSTVYYDGSLAVGSKLFTDEAMTIPVSDGDHEIDGQIYVVSGGAGEISEVKEKAADTGATTDALIEQINNLKTTFAEKEKKLNDALKNANAANAQTLADMKKDFDKLKTLALSDDTPNPEQRGTRVDPKFMEKTLDKMTPKERALKRVADRKNGVTVSTGGY